MCENPMGLSQTFGENANVHEEAIPKQFTTVEKDVAYSQFNKLNNCILKFTHIPVMFPRLCHSSSKANQDTTILLNNITG